MVLDTSKMLAGGLVIGCFEVGRPHSVEGGLDIYMAI